jgi:hypothetical protein
LRANGPGVMNDRFGERQTRGTRWRLVAQLHQTDAAAETGVRDAQRIEPARLAKSGVDDGVERAQTASASPAPPPRFRSAA